MSDLSYNEHRRYRRVNLETAVAVTVHGKFLVQNSLQISEGGMLLRIFSQYLVGDILEIGFFIPGGHFVKATAEVAYALEPMPGETFVGIRFVDLDSAHQLAIRQYVATVGA